MTQSAALELQYALYDVLSTDEVVAKLLAVPAAIKGLPPNTRVMLFDKVPDPIMNAFLAGNAPTYATLGDGNERYEIYGEETAAEDDPARVEITHHMLVFHVFSQQVGLREAKEILLAMRAAIVNAYAKMSLDLGANRMLSIDAFAASYDRTNDGFTSHAALTMTAKTQPKT